MSLHNFPMSLVRNVVKLENVWDDFALTLVSDCQMVNLHEVMHDYTLWTL